MADEQSTGRTHDWPRIFARMTVLWLVGAALGALYAALTGASLGNGIAGGIMVGSIVSIVLIALEDDRRT